MSRKRRQIGHIVAPHGLPSNIDRIKTVFWTIRRSLPVVWRHNIASNIDIPTSIHPDIISAAEGEGILQIGKRIGNQYPIYTRRDSDKNIAVSLMDVRKKWEANQKLQRELSKQKIAAVQLPEK